MLKKKKKKIQNVEKNSKRKIKKKKKKSKYFCSAMILCIHFFLIKTRLRSINSKLHTVIPTIFHVNNDLFHSKPHQMINTLAI